MQLSLLVLGKTDSAQIETEIKRYESRLKHYLPFELRVIPDVRRGSKLTSSMNVERAIRAEPSLRSLSEQWCRVSDVWSSLLVAPTASPQRSMSELTDRYR